MITSAPSSNPSVSTSKSSRVKNLGVIGCGLRADAYLRQLRPGLGREWQVAALADPNPRSIEIYQRHYGNPRTAQFTDGPELLRRVGDELDAAIIASPNWLHKESLLPALERKLVVLVEKPVATTIGDCAAMWSSFVAADCPPVTVGFSLRYTPFYRKVKEIIDSGAIGKVLTVEASELMGAPLTTMFTRHWRRKTELAGPMILEKCCHDMDLLGWFAGTPAARVSSFASLTRFVTDPRAGSQCGNCQLESTCRYSSFKVAPYWYNEDTTSAVAELLPKKEDALCVYNSDKDVADHQVVSIEYENGLLASFSVCMDQPRTTRLIKVNGTEGQISGDFGRDQLQIARNTPGDYKNETIEQIKVRHDGSGHGGGDSVMTRQFEAMLRGELRQPRIGLREGIEAALVALAADRSVREGRIISMRELMAQVFGD